MAHPGLNAIDYRFEVRIDFAFSSKKTVDSAREFLPQLFALPLPDSAGLLRHDLL
jgi:hypothetical protein